MIPTLAQLAPIDQLKALQELFGGGMLGAIVAFILASWVGLLTMLLRAKNAHLAMAEKLAPISAGMKEVLAEAVEELKTAREVLELHKPKKRPRPPGLSTDAPTVILQPGSVLGTGGKKEG